MMNKILKNIETQAAESLNQETCQHIFQLVDYTILNTADNHESVLALVNKTNGFRQKFGVNVAALCVFPNFIETVKSNLTDKMVKTAAVSASFPASQTFAEVKKLETQLAIAAGADDIDVVMALGKFLSGNHEELKAEITMLKHICGKKHLKVILETSLMPGLQHVEKASMLCLEAGADFIKTSTGKNGSKASLDAFVVMCQCVHKYYETTGEQRGIKPAGGITTVSEALKYFMAVKTILGNEWLNPEFFRIGASSLLEDLERYL